METDCFIVYIKADYICKENTEDVETRFDTSNYQLAEPLLKGKNKKVTGLVKDDLGGKNMIKVVELAETYSYLIDGSSEVKK